MAVEASLSSLLVRLEAQMEVHRERERFHAEQEAHHRSQRELHAAELEKVGGTMTEEWVAKDGPDGAAVIGAYRGM